MVFFAVVGKKKGFTECFPPFSGNPSTGALELRSSLETIGHVWQIFDPSRCTTTTSVPKAAAVAGRSN